jgi:hypothetical protein
MESVLLMLQNSVRSRAWQQRLQKGFEIIRMTPGIFQQVRRSLFRCAHYARQLEVNTAHCLESSGGRKSETIFQLACVRTVVFSCVVCRFTFCRFSCAFFVHPVWLQTVISSHNFAGWAFYCSLLLPFLLVQMNSINSATKTWDEFLVLSNATRSETIVLTIRHPEICNVLSRAFLLMSLTSTCLITFSCFPDVYHYVAKEQ